jgi:hypothetical protein
MDYQPLSQIRNRKSCFLLVGRLLAMVALVLLLSVVLLGGEALHATSDNPPTPDDVDRLGPPILSDPPTFVDQGHYTYYLYCMVCHGDRGQGLTKEWRNAGDPGDANCWQSKCHAANHPPEGFELPRYAPPVIGRGTLARFETVDDLYQFLKTRMPWQAPGSLSDEEYRQLAAYLAFANQTPNVSANPEWLALANLPLHPSNESAPEQITSPLARAWLGFVMAGGLGMVLLRLLWVWIQHKRRQRRPAGQDKS